MTTSKALPAEQCTDAIVESFLLQRGAGPDCYVISDLQTVDGKEMPLREALRFGWPGPDCLTIICCLPAPVALYMRGTYLIGPRFHILTPPTDARVASPQEPPPYMAAITEPLIRFLEHAAHLPDFYVAGHAANLDFWVGEIRHCLAVLDDYPERLDRMKKGRQAFERQHDLCRLGANKRTLPDEERAKLRLRLSEAAEAFLRRCNKEGFLTPNKLTEMCADLGLTRP